MLLLSCKTVAPDYAKQELVGHWQGKIDKDSKEWNLELDISIEERKLIVYASLPDYGVFLQPTEIDLDKPKMRISAQNRDKEIVLDVHFQNGQMTGSFSGFKIEAMAKLQRSSNNTFQYFSKEIKFKSGQTNLSGTLFSPSQEKSYPTIILVHPSGKQTRDDSHNQMVTFLLLRNGFAVFSYDLRGKGESEGDSYRLLPFEIQGADAISAAEVLQNESLVNTQQLGIYGLSQGGWTAPFAASRSDLFKFMIVVSAAGINAYEQDLYVNEQLLQNDRYSNEQKAEIQKYLDNAKSESPEEHVKNFDTNEKKRMVDFFLYDPLPDWRKIKIPVLAIWGSEDQLVPAEKSYNLIKNALKDAGNQNAELIVIPHVNHGMWIIRDNGTEWDFDRRSPIFFDKVINWLQFITK